MNRQTPDGKVGFQLNFQAFLYTHPGGPWHALLLPGTHFVIYVPKLIVFLMGYFQFLIPFPPAVFLFDLDGILHDSDHKK